MGARGRGVRAGQRGGPQRVGGQRKRAELGEAVREALALARRHVQAGEHQTAAGLLEELATRLERRGEHGMASHLQVRAANALLDHGDADAALAAAGTAVDYAVGHPHRGRIVTKFARLVGRLRGAGHETGAEALQATAMERLAVDSLKDGVNKQVNRKLRRQLPKRCHTCATPVEASTVEFDEDGAAECATCGVVLLGGTE